MKAFALYGLLRKTAPADALLGLSIETFILLPPALAFATYLAAKFVRLPRLPIAVGIALIILATLRPATAAAHEVYFPTPRGNHDPLRLIPVEMSGPSRVQLFPMP